MGTLIRDLRYGLRTLVRNPGFADRGGAYPGARHWRQHRHL